MTKLCRKCGIHKALSDFQDCSYNVSGKQSTCNQCLQYMERGMNNMAMTMPYEGKGMELNFRDLKRTAGELGEEAFKDMAPRMYEIYKEMKTISGYEKLSEILEGN